MRRISKHPLSALTASALFGLASHAASAAPSYTVTDLGTTGGPVSAATSLNEAGVVAGYSYTSTGQSHAVVWRNGGVRDLGTLGGSYSGVAGINEAGVMAGYAYTSGDSASRATIWRNNSVMDLGTLGGTYSSANAINDYNQVVGASNLPGNASVHATYWTNGRKIDLGTLGGSYSTAQAINNQGWAVATAIPAAMAPAMRRCGAARAQSTWARWAAPTAMRRASTTPASLQAPVN